MKAIAVIVAALWLPQCAPEPTIDAEPAAATVYVDPPYVADAAGVPTVDPPITPGPDGTTNPGTCSQYELLIYFFQPPAGWDIGRMSRYMWRESRCTPDVRSTTSDSGLLQINDVNLPYLRIALGEWVDRYTLLDPVQNVRAAAALCAYWRNAGRSCYAPWGGRG